MFRAGDQSELVPQCPFYLGDDAENRRKSETIPTSQTLVSLVNGEEKRKKRSYLCCLTSQAVS